MPLNTSINSVKRALIIYSVVILWLVFWVHCRLSNPLGSRIKTCLPSRLALVLRCNHPVHLKSCFKWVPPAELYIFLLNFRQRSRIPPAVIEARSVVISRIQSLIQERYGKNYTVECFGSTQYGADSPDSDLDLVVVVSHVAHIMSNGLNNITSGSRKDERLCTKR